MRNFRTAAVAAATAVTVAFGGTAVASAESSATNENTTSSSSSSSSLTQLGKDWGAWSEGEDGKPVVEADDQVTGEDMFGKEVAKDIPEWASNWKKGATALGITSVIGAIIGAYNYAVYNGIIPQHILDPIFRR
ncbi:MULTISPECIES: hypothetical protein [Corynebacterium]|uniref:hypothetical protein n=1 Tax=Corynebacterium TaxID=1716 RepID=UPI0021A9298D|nr:MULTISPECIES: hypothetical protein [Corynebacterium]MCT1428689.1 hypothetical protein [Corynebacterium sp. p3-SID1241]MDV2432233.1 hypothetical protein [Corynebacterium tuberculostearicum]WKE57735.1 hypothetical protein J8247_02075 [Corynebacterium tuberculostearicum]WKE59232.1 hypothetical protein KAH61_09605 [Corynebacterium tuberculostearicum]